MDRLPMSANVPAEIAERDSDVQVDLPELDECDMDELKHIVPERICSSLARLMEARQNILRDQRIGDYVAEEASASLLVKLEYLYQDLKILWEEEA